MLKNNYLRMLIEKEGKHFILSFIKGILIFLCSCQNFALAESLWAERHGACLACEGCLPVPLLRILSFLIIGPTLPSRASLIERVLKTQAVFVVVQHSVHTARGEEGRLLARGAGETQPHVETRKATMKGLSCSYRRPTFSTVILAIVSWLEHTLRF